MKKHIFITFLSVALFQGFIFAEIASVPDSDTSQSSIKEVFDPIKEGAILVSDYQDEDVLISFSRAYSKTDYKKGDEFFIELKLKILANNKIIKLPYPVGILVLDNFGNDLQEISTGPFCSDSLRPGDEKLFTIKFSIKPLENTEYLLLKIPRSIFGNVNPFELKIVKPVFFATDEFGGVAVVPQPPEGFTEEIAISPTLVLDELGNVKRTNPIWQIAAIFLIGIVICLVGFVIYKYIFWQSLRMISQLWKVKKIILIYSVVSLLIFFFSIVIAVAEEDIIVIFVTVFWIAVQWGVYYLIKWLIRYLKRKSHADWITIVSVWIACIVFLILALFCWTGTDEDNIFTQFIIGSISIAVVLATVLFSIKKMKG